MTKMIDCPTMGFASTPWLRSYLRRARRERGYADSFRPRHGVITRMTRGPITQVGVYNGWGLIVRARPRLLPQRLHFRHSYGPAPTLTADEVLRLPEHVLRRLRSTPGRYMGQPLRYLASRGKSVPELAA